MDALKACGISHSLRFLIASIHEKHSSILVSTEKKLSGTQHALNPEKHKYPMMHLEQHHVRHKAQSVFLRR